MLFLLIFDSSTFKRGTLSGSVSSGGNRKDKLLRDLSDLLRHFVLSVRFSCNRLSY